MKSIIALCLFLWTAQAYEYALTPVKVSEDVHCFFGALENITKENGGNMVNTCFVQTKQGFVVIDSGPTYAYAKQAYTQMQMIENLPVKYVINTHDHDDHWLGNSFYKSKDALLIGPRTYEQNVVVGMETRMQRTLGSEIYGKTEIVSLDTVVDNNLTLNVGGKILEIQQLVSKAHTQGDLIVYLPDEKVLFAGDLVFNGRVTSIRDGSIIGSIKALEKIEARHPKVIIGGHGYKTDANATQALKSYLLEMKEAVLDALDNDVSIEQVTKKVTMPKYKEMKLYDILHSRNVFEAYRELEMYDEDEE
ncbi:MBL fold metallo-hydrolase [Sulfurovum sp. XTW-4]|uniref:MBL fold metallo-hydrolase n=1 Tax=Sulfurovum xiamenensis TaxID=3019066 RepID=A0ABT7QSX2_9BACT|nr:MBL fold metallo-hydrolase [Sulfurovum xiamenensis]MDM5264173.1 MBL fold metallo-hydrolase [Sulfurovum xiamenensis]